MWKNILPLHSHSLDISTYRNLITFLSTQSFSGVHSSNIKILKNKIMTCKRILSVIFCLLNLANIAFAAGGKYNITYESKNILCFDYNRRKCPTNLFYSSRSMQGIWCIERIQLQDILPFERSETLNTKRWGTDQHQFDHIRL